ncbi:MAG TPA: maleylpyruvate isomerase family mycothiol-dependent enzyme [Actinospica sp.]|nr:maleylpyruvate isomerase family mycothiol-dependent enzyme [Actinospica sp.]
MDTFTLIADERRALADVLEQLTPQQWSAPSLCRGWTIHDLTAHLVMGLETTMPEFLRTLMMSRGNFDRANVKLTARWSTRDSGDLTAALRRHADSRFTPPGQGPAAPLVEILVHAMDVRRALDIDRPIPPESVRPALDFLAAFRLPPGAPGPNLVPRGLLDRLQLEATDLDWFSGRGAAARGTGADLLLAVTGRRVGADQLTGPGAEILQRRLT